MSEWLGRRSGREGTVFDRENRCEMPDFDGYADVQGPALSIKSRKRLEAKMCGGEGGGRWRGVCEYLERRCLRRKRLGVSSECPDHC